MGWKATVRAMEAAARRQERDAQKRLREVNRQVDDRARLSAIEQARLEVEAFEGGLEVLLSIHREQGETWNWQALAASLPPPTPPRFSYLEFGARNRLEALSVVPIIPSPPHEGKFSPEGEAEFQRKLREEQRLANAQLGRQLEAKAAIEEARLQDERDHQADQLAYIKEHAEWEELKILTRRILAGEHKAYTEALVEFSALAEISELGSSAHFTVHSAKMLECRLKVNGRQAIPTELKTLTATGKVSVKPMPKGRFHEIYQDYACGCVLRVAREVFALLPVETVLVTASVDALDSRTGQTVERPVLSAAMGRETLQQLDFERIDPSDAMENFLHRGDFKASRKSGEFETIVPLTPADLPRPPLESMDSPDLLDAVRRMRDEVRSEMENLNPQPATTASPTTQPL